MHTHVSDYGADAARERPAVSLARVAEELERDGVPLARELTEMILACDGDLAAAPSSPACDLLGEPMTRAEETAGRLLTTLARYARDARLDDETLALLMRLGTVCASRFDSYLVERTVF